MFLKSTGHAFKKPPIVTLATKPNYYNTIKQQDNKTLLRSYCIVELKLTCCNPIERSSFGAVPEARPDIGGWTKSYDHVWKIPARITGETDRRR